MATTRQDVIAVYTLRIPRFQLDRLHDIAAAEHRTTVQKLRVMVEEEIARHDQSSERSVA